MLPKAGQSYNQERLGIAAVQMWAAQVGQIWRETATGDVGIDGQLEYVNDVGFATGKTVAVQVKSGESYFRNSTVGGWKFYPEQKHKTYWELYPMPVLLVLHNPTTNLSYWLDARQSLRIGLDCLIIPDTNILQETDSVSIFRNIGVQNNEFFDDLDNLLIYMANKKIDEVGCKVSFLDIFCHGLTNICRSVYFDIGLVSEAIQFNLYNSEGRTSYTIDENTHNFAFDYVKFLLGQNLAILEFSDCLIDWEERKMQPLFVAPLTRRGRNLVNAIHNRENEFVEKGLLRDGKGRHVAQEGFIAMVFESYSPRLGRIYEFQEQLRNLETETGK